MQTSTIEQQQVRATGQVPRGIRVAVKSLFKSYDGRDILKSVDLTLEPGEFVAVVGRSGCGKSTLLRLIAQLETADHGALTFGDGDHRPETRIMFQDSRLLPWKRVLQNVALGLPKKNNAVQALGQVGLAERANEWPAVLSGGQRQRVALARALIHDPELLLLDEPLGALDALTRIEMQQLIESLWQQRGFTALLVTHDVQEAIALADRVVLIEDGRITLDERIALARPRARGSLAFAQLEERILSRVLQQPQSEAHDDEVGDVSLQRAVNRFAWAV
jgi:sulfonate transport system ATP-binding protein